MARIDGDWHALGDLGQYQWRNSSNGYQKWTLYFSLIIEEYMSTYLESEKFILLLATHVGGLGINLMTADISVLYDSD